jgi:hypothetical protein
MAGLAPILADKIFKHPKQYRKKPTCKNMPDNIDSKRKGKRTRVYFLLIEELYSLR